jgi:hypothetical protein
MSSGSGQLRPAARKRLSVARTVDGATPTRRAISWFDKSLTNFNRRTSRTWRIVVLSAGIRSLPWTAKGGTGCQQRHRQPGRTHLGTVGEIISEWWAELSRNGGRHHSGIMGDIARNRHDGVRTSGHSGRRTYAMGLNAKGVGRKTIQKLTGHKHIATTAHSP